MNRVKRPTLPPLIISLPMNCFLCLQAIHSNANQLYDTRDIFSEAASSNGRGLYTLGIPSKDQQTTKLHLPYHPWQFLISRGTSPNSDSHFLASQRLLIQPPNREG